MASKSHICPVSDNGELIPVRIQIIFCEKVSEDEVIFDPLDNEENFKLFASGGDTVVNSELHIKSANLDMTESFSEAAKSHYKDKEKAIAELSAGSTANDWSSEKVRGSKPRDKLPKDSFQAALNVRVPAKMQRTWKETLCSPPSPPTIPISYFETTVGCSRKQAEAHESDPSCEDRSHQPSNHRLTSGDFPKADTQSDLVKSTPLLPTHCLAVLSPKSEDNSDLQAYREMTRVYTEEEDNFVNILNEIDTDMTKEVTSQQLELSQQDEQDRRKTSPVKQSEQWDNLHQGEDIGPQPYSGQQKELTEDGVQKDLCLKKVVSNLGKHIEKL